MRILCHVEVQSKHGYTKYEPRRIAGLYNGLAVKLFFRLAEVWRCVRNRWRGRDRWRACERRRCKSWSVYWCSRPVRRLRWCWWRCSPVAAPDLTGPPTWEQEG